MPRLTPITSKSALPARHQDVFGFVSTICNALEVTPPAGGDALHAAKERA